MRRLITGLLFAAAPAWAQDPPPAEEAEPAPLPTVPVEEPAPEAPPVDDRTVLEEITVTAERKVATLQETPISIESFNAEDLALRGIDGLFGLAANVPNLTI